MPTRMPVVFVSHGAPDALLKAPDAVACWREIGQRVGMPSAILAVSAHWEARRPMASLAGVPDTVHDFSGFDPALHRMQYPAPGAPALAERAVWLLVAAGIAAELHPSRGLDHGAWVPLSAMFPQANVPVTQISIVRSGSPEAHYAIGQALAPLRDEGILILASGAITHNFGWLDWRAGTDAAPLSKAQRFSDWVGERLAAPVDEQALPAGVVPDAADQVDRQEDQGVVADAASVEPVGAADAFDGKRAQPSASPPSSS